jgi:hypothetical protein
VVRRIANAKRCDAVIALGAVIRGGTAHFDYVAGQCAAGLAQASVESGVPVSFGVLTTDTVEQAIERAGTKAGNKGVDAALAALELANLLRRMDVEDAPARRPFARARPVAARDAGFIRQLAGQSASSCTQFAVRGYGDAEEYFTGLVDGVTTSVAALDTRRSRSSTGLAQLGRSAAVPGSACRAAAST